MRDMIFSLASLTVAAFAFGLGAAKLFKAKKPLYLQLLVCAAGCFAIEQLSLAVNLWCGIERGFSVGMLGIFGCNFFLLSANFGTLDKIVDDGRGTEKARVFAFIAPVFTAALAAVTFFGWRESDLFCAWAWVFMLIPALPASYFNLKHILLPVDPFGFLAATKPCNVAALVFYAVTAAYAFSQASGGAWGGVLSVIMSLSVLALSLCAIRGEKRWGI